MDSTYVNKFAISQTAMKEWKEMPPKKWYETWITKTRKRPFRSATQFGSYLDCLMFTPKDLDKRFIVSDIELPSEKVSLITSEIYNRLLELNVNADKINAETIKNAKKGTTPVILPKKEIDFSDKELVISFCQKNDYYKSKPDQAYNTIIKEGTKYFTFLSSTNGRNVISSEDKKMAEKLREVLLTDPVSQGFFIPKKNCEVIFQQLLYSEFEVNYENVQIVPTKGAVDIVHINHKRKEIREVDLKCTDDAFMFDSYTGPIKRFDYIGQHSFYDYLLRDWIKKYKNGIFKDYSIMNPLNVVIDQETQIPYLYEYNQNDLYIKRYGIDNTKIRGWEDTINEISFHLDCGDWSRPMQHIKNGKMLVSAFAKR